MQSIPTDLLEHSSDATEYWHTRFSHGQFVQMYNISNESGSSIYLMSAEHIWDKLLLCMASMGSFLDYAKLQKNPKSAGQ